MRRDSRLDCHCCHHVASVVRRLLLLLLLLLVLQLHLLLLRVRTERHAAGTAVGRHHVTLVLDLLLWLRPARLRLANTVRVVILVPLSPLMLLLLHLVLGGLLLLLLVRPV